MATDHTQFKWINPPDYKKKEAELEAVIEGLSVLGIPREYILDIYSEYGESHEERIDYIKSLRYRG